MKPFRFLASLVLAFLVSLPMGVQAQALTDTGENKILDATFRAQALGAPASFYVGLDTVACDDTGGGTEVSGGAYARVEVVSSLTAWKSTQGNDLASTGTGGSTSNSAAITFPAPSGAAWGLVKSFRLWDAPTSGNAWFCQTLTAEKNIGDGDAAPSFAIGAMTFTFQ